MKTKIVIIEDDYYKYLTTRQILKSKMRMAVEEVSVDSAEALYETTASVKPDVILYRTRGAVLSLIRYFQGKNIHRRNAEIILIAIPEECMSQVNQVERISGRKKVRLAEAA